LIPELAAFSTAQSYISKTATKPTVVRAGTLEAAIIILVSRLHSSDAIQFSFVLLTGISVGGHASEKFSIPEGVEITKVEVGRDSYALNGLRFHMSNGKAGGYLYDGSAVHTLGRFQFSLQ